jgi:hypothetical protein
LLVVIVLISLLYIASAILDRLFATAPPVSWKRHGRAMNVSHEVWSLHKEVVVVIVSSK